MAEVKKIIVDSEILKEDCQKWPPHDKVGRQELEIYLDGEHINFIVRLLILDLKIRLIPGCLEVARPRRTLCLLLPRLRREDHGLFANKSAFPCTASRLSLLIINLKLSLRWRPSWRERSKSLRWWSDAWGRSKSWRWCQPWRRRCQTRRPYHSWRRRYAWWSASWRSNSHTSCGPCKPRLRLAWVNLERSLQRLSFPRPTLSPFTKSSSSLSWRCFCSHSYYVLASEQNKSKRPRELFIFFALLLSLDYFEFFSVGEHKVEVFVESDESADEHARVLHSDAHSIVDPLQKLTAARHYLF